MEPDEMNATHIKHIEPSFFTPEDIGKTFGAGFLDESICRDWILRRIHGEKIPSCPECNTELPEKALQRFWNAERIKCRSCGKFFTALTGTFLRGCHMDFRTIVLLAVFLHLKVRTEQAAEMLGTSKETVRLWRKKYTVLEMIRNYEGEETAL